jgi:hypothetical protein
VRAIVFTCAHTKPGQDLNRFDWLGSLIEDVKPDYVVDLGDFDDMQSLNSYDSRKPRIIVDQNYEKDIEIGQQARDRIWGRFREKKKKRPWRIGFEGNHENRIKRAVESEPRLEGSKLGIGFGHLQTDYWYDEYHEYLGSGPSIVAYDGVSYAHYFSAGNSGTAVSGIHHAYSLLQLRHSSSTCGHSHKRSLYIKDGAYPNPILGLVAGNFKGDDDDWAGQSPSDWWSGVVIKHDIENGNYDPEFVSLARLEKAYG